jgi:hypothetical protein
VVIWLTKPPNEKGKGATMSLKLWMGLKAVIVVIFAVGFSVFGLVFAYFLFIKKSV